MLNERCKTNVI